MAATPSSSLNFLKEGLLLPCRNMRLFAAVFTILVAWISLLLVAYELGVEPIKLEVGHDMDALMSTGSGGPEYALLFRKTQEDYLALLLASAVFLVSVNVTVGSVAQLVSLFAAVTTYSDDGKVHTFGTLLGRAKQQLTGAALTVAFVCALRTGALALLLASATLVAFLAYRQYYHYGLFLAGCLVLLAAFFFYVFLSFFCSLTIVVALDESAARRRRHGAGAVGRAWQLVKGWRRRAVLFVSVMTSVLAAVFGPVYWYWLAKSAPGNMASGAVLLGVLHTVLMAGLELFQDCALIVFYYECKGRSAQGSETEYVKLSIQDAR